MTDLCKYTWLAKSWKLVLNYQEFSYKLDEKFTFESVSPLSVNRKFCIEHNICLDTTQCISLINIYSLLRLFFLISWICSTGVPTA